MTRLQQKWTIIDGKWVQIPMVLSRENGRLVERHMESNERVAA